LNVLLSYLGEVRDGKLGTCPALKRDWMAPLRLIGYQLITR
jgi:hypothetical protein